MPFRAQCSFLKLVGGQTSPKLVGCAYHLSALQIGGRM